jgi:hypothetical protein
MKGEHIPAATSWVGLPASLERVAGGAPGPNAGADALANAGPAVSAPAAALAAAQ